MGDKFTHITESGAGQGWVELLGPCEPLMLFKGEKGTPPAKLDEEFKLGYITGTVGVGEPQEINLPDGVSFVMWSQFAQLTITDAGVAWYVLDGQRDMLDVNEDPVRPDEYVLSKDGAYMGKVTLK